MKVWLKRSWRVVVCCLFLVSVSGGVLAQEPALTNTIGMEFVLIPAGTFMMGADSTDKNVAEDETPRHEVTISTAFYIGKYEVTQAQWVAVMGGNPSKFQGKTDRLKIFHGLTRSFLSNA